MYQRAKYKDNSQKDWYTLPNPVATPKRDGGHFFLSIDSTGQPHYFSRRESVKGGFPERSEKLPHLVDKKLPDFAGHVFSVELIHTGHDKNAIESHPNVSGILNSLPFRAIETQKNTGPVRAVLLDVINPSLQTYRDKLIHMKSLEKTFGDPNVLFVDDPVIDKKGILSLIDKTRKQGREGIIVTSLTLPESNNPRIKVKHFYTFNLRVSRVIQEYDVSGKPKNSMGSLECVDSSGRVVCYVGTGFSRDQRIEIWKNPKKWIGKLIQIKTMGLQIVGGRLRSPVYNGESDGSIDKV